MAQPDVAWYEDDLILTLENLTDEVLTQLAFQGEALAKANIQANGQIDTGFMLNSTYGIGPTGDHRQEAEASAGAAADRPLAGQMRLDAHEAGIHAAAEYAAYQEMRQSFLYKAVEELAREAEGVISTTARKWSLL